MPSTTIVEIPNQETLSSASYPVSPNPTPQDLAILTPEHAYQSKWAFMEPVHRSRDVIRILRRNLGLEGDWGGLIEGRGFFDRETVSADVWVADNINYAIGYMRIPGGGRHMFAMFRKDRLNEAARVVRRSGVYMLGPSACWNIAQHLSLLPNGGPDESVVFHNVLERRSRHRNQVVALRYALCAAMHHWLLERRAAGLPAVTVAPEIDDFMSS